MREATIPRATVKMAPLLADMVDAAPVSVVPFMVVPFMSMPPAPAAVIGEVLLVALAAASVKALRVLGPLAGGLMTPTMPSWQWLPREQ